MERIIKFNPAFDERNENPRKNYGIHGVDLRMILKGEHGAVQFVLYTNWHLPHVQKEIDERIKSNIKVPYILDVSRPLPADKGYHSKTQMYEGQEIVTNSCEYCDGQSCYYDGSGSEAEELFEILLREGSEGVWEELERYYNSLFNNK
jgi:hypothetical protein